MACGALEKETCARLDLCCFSPSSLQRSQDSAYQFPALDWAPLFLEPANGVDGVITGHDHFYARNYRMGRLQDKSQPGVLFLTTAGGGASLYPTLARDYVA